MEALTDEQPSLALLVQGERVRAIGPGEFAVSVPDRA